jgi:hypothetical protein
VQHRVSPGTGARVQKLQRVAQQIVVHQSHSSLIEDHEDALDVLDDCLTTLALLIEAQRGGRRLSARTVDKFEKQCTAAAVASAKLRAKLAKT